MKTASLIFISFIFSFTIANAQTPKSDNPSTRAAYLELGGPSFYYSFNYDFRFHPETPGGWGMRFGAGGYAVENSYAFSIPVLVNYLTGKKGNYFETAFGAIAGGSSGGPLLMDPASFPLAACIYIGFRAQPSDDGIVFMAGVPFVIGSTKTDPYMEEGVYKVYAVPSWPSIAFGMAF